MTTCDHGIWNPLGPQCRRIATVEADHPVIGPVPLCDEHADWAESLGLATRPL